MAVSLIRHPWTIISFDRVPMYRGLAWALQDCRNNGWHGHVVSADRRDPVIRRFNRLHHTNLHSQAYLYYGWIHRRPGFLPANPPTMGTHLLRGDGVVGRPGHSLPRHWLGLDVTEWDQLLRVAHGLGYDLRQPYRTGSEAHHVNFFHDPHSRARRRLVAHRLRRRHK